MRIFPSVLGILIFINFHGQTNGLDVESLDSFLEYREKISQLADQYEAIFESARTQISRLVRVWNAQFLSQIAFTLNELKGIGSEYREMIAVRELELGSESQCVEAAKNILNNATESKGLQIQEITRKSVEALSSDQHNLVLRYLRELTLVVDNLRMEFLYWFTKSNPVTQFPELLSGIRKEYALIKSLTEVSVLGIVEEIKYLEKHIKLSQAEIFPQLQGIVESFKTVAWTLAEKLYLFCFEHEEP